MNYDYRYEPKPHRGEPLYWSPLVDAMRDHGLTENKARIYLMRVIEKKPYDEICVRLGISRQTAINSTHVAKTGLKKENFRFRVCLECDNYSKCATSEKGAREKATVCAHFKERVRK